MQPEYKIHIPTARKRKKLRKKKIGPYYWVPYGTAYPDDDWSFWWFFIFLLFVALFIVPIIVLVARTPPPPPPPVPPMLRAHKDAGCAAGDHFDERINGCAPDVYVPVPVNNRLMDNTVGACESFFRHTCGTWIDTHPKEVEYEARAFGYISRENRYDLDEIIKNAPKHSPLQRFYSSCKDALVVRSYQSRKFIGETIKTLIGKMQIRSIDQVPQKLGILHRMGYATPYLFSVEKHPLEEGKLIMLRANRKLFTQIPPMKELVRMFEHIHGDGSERAIHLAAVLDTMLLRLQMTIPNNDVDDEDYITYINDGAFERDLYPNEDMEDYAEVYPLVRNTTKLWIPYGDKEFIIQSDKTKYTIEQWRAFLEYSVYASSLNFFPDLENDVYYRHHTPLKRSYHHLNRNETVAPYITEDQCQRLTLKLLPGLVAKEYLERLFPGESIRDNIVEVAEAIRDEGAEMIRRTLWLSQGAKDLLIDKMQKIIVRAVHPNHWEAEPFAIKLRSDRYLNNLNMIRRYRVAQNEALWNTGVDRDASQRFGAPLSTVNAFYSPITNTITVFAGIARYPFYHKKYNKASIYATLGSIIGHELSHAFDSSGIYFDGKGLVTSKQLTAQDWQHFEEKEKCVMREYDTPDGCTQEGYNRQVLGESMADLIGLRMAYQAYFKRDDIALKPGIHQYFFYAWAENWCEVSSQKATCAQVHSDVHPTAIYRVDKTVRNLEAFRKAFNCPIESPMVNEDQCVVFG